MNRPQVLCSGVGLYEWLAPNQCLGRRKRREVEVNVVLRMTEYDHDGLPQGLRSAWAYSLDRILRSDEPAFPCLLCLLGQSEYT